MLTEWEISDDHQGFFCAFGAIYYFLHVEAVCEFLFLTIRKKEVSSILSLGIIKLALFNV